MKAILVVFSLFCGGLVSAVTPQIRPPVRPAPPPTSSGGTALPPGALRPSERPQDRKMLEEFERRVSEVRNRQAGLADQLERKGKDLQKRTANIDKVLNDRSKISAENAQKIRSTREKAIREMQESARKLRQEIQKAKESNDSQPAR